MLLGRLALRLELTNLVLQCFHAKLHLVITSVALICSIAVGIAVPRRASETDERAVITQRAALWSKLQRCTAATRVHQSRP
jgi:hypothetical protein